MKTRHLCLIGIALSLAALPAFSTSLVRLSLDQLTRASSAVLQGHVIAQTSQWNARHSEIITLTTVAVDQNIKGATPATVVVQQLGGTVGRLRVAVPGEMHFYPQARYELFLQPSQSNPAHFLLVCMREGAYRIYTDPVTHQERVINPMGGAVYRHAPGQAQGTSGASPAEPVTMPLDQFQQRVSIAAAATIVVPSGTAIPLTVRSVSYAGVGRIQLEATASADIYPNAHVIIPAGSLIDGWGQESGGRWTLHWTEISIRGARARITASSSAADGAANLQGAHFTAVVR